MIRTLRHSRAPLWVGLSVVLGSLLGCSDPEPAGPPADEPEVLVKEPIQGVPNAPPFGAPREKLTPGEYAEEASGD